MSIILKLSSSAVKFVESVHFALLRVLVFPARGQLPPDYVCWKLNRRTLQTPSNDDDHWLLLAPFLKYHGLTLWEPSGELCGKARCQKMEDLPAPNGYRFIPANAPHTADQMKSLYLNNGLYRIVRKGNHDYVMRAFSVAGLGMEHLNLIRMLSASSPDNLLSNNHILPLVEEYVFHDIIFGIFPMTGRNLTHALNPAHGPNTVEDILYLLMQALEAIIYIHGKNIAHRDLFSDNFVIEWSPQSVTGQSWTRPRLYLIDFETAVHFPEDTDPSKKLVSGMPFGEWPYARKVAPELLSTAMYCPFRLDIWQFGRHLVQYFSETGIDEIDTLWPTLMADNPEDRPTALEVFDKLGHFINSVPPQSLQRGYTHSPLVYDYPILFMTGNQDDASSNQDDASW